MASGPVDRADVVVVGGGPAGAAAAITLAKAGRDVVVVDRARFPRDKCCGDGLTTLALRWLERLGLAPELAPSLTVGAVLGVILGSGVVLETSRERPVARDQVTLLFVFVGIFHAMLEETAAVFAFGGNGLIMVATRFAFGVAAFWVYRRWLDLRRAALDGRVLAPQPARHR